MTASAASLRILHVARRFAPMLGGTERYVHDLARAQVMAGHEVTVFTLDRDVVGVVKGKLAAAEVAEGIRIIRVPGVGNRRAAITARPDLLIRVMRSSDVVHLHDMRFVFGIATIGAWLLRRHLIFHTHGLIFHTEWAQRLKRMAMRVAFGPLLRLSSAYVIADSEPDRETLIALAPYLASRTRLLEDAIDIADLLKLTRRPTAGFVVSLGRIAASKGLDRMIRALALLDTNVSWRLRLAGPADPREVDRLRRLIGSLQVGGRVEIAGPYPQGGELEILAEAHIAAFPSPGEGFGLALLEAMAAGVPVVANDIAAHRALLGAELVDRLTDFDDAPSAAAAIGRLLDGSSDYLASIETRERARAREFGIDRLLRQIDELYAELLIEPSGGS